MHAEYGLVSMTSRNRACQLKIIDVAVRDRVRDAHLGARLSDQAEDDTDQPKAVAPPGLLTDS